MRKASRKLTTLQGTRKKQTNPKGRRREEVLRIRMEINETETRKTLTNFQQKLNLTQFQQKLNLFFKKINKIFKPLARYLKEREKSFK